MPVVALHSNCGFARFVDCISRSFREAVKRRSGLVTLPLYYCSCTIRISKTDPFRLSVYNEKLVRLTVLRHNCAEN